MITLKSWLEIALSTLVLVSPGLQVSWSLRSPLILHIGLCAFSNQYNVQRWKNFRFVRVSINYIVYYSEDWKDLYFNVYILWKPQKWTFHVLFTKGVFTLAMQTQAQTET